MALPDLKQLYVEAFDAEIAERTEESGIEPALWKASGKASKAYPNKEDEFWWRDHGPQMAQDYADWRESTAWVLWETPAGEPGIELELKCSFGDVPVRMFIDRLFVTPDGQLVLVDMKSGARSPADQGLQLGFYSSGCEVVFGIRPAMAFYYEARKGGLGVPYDVDHLTPDYLGHILGDFVRARESGLFIPNLSQNCGNCGVKRACPAINGPEAHLYTEGK